ncbi:Zn-ribbon domain-containing OB-fold protein [Chloroflexota bacterium]
MEYKLTFKEFNEALKNDKLLGLKCQQCGNINVPPKMVCGKCVSTDMEVVELGDKGKIQTFTTINVASEGREAEVPYTIVMVELDEGPWVMGNLGSVDHKSTSMELIGKTVKMKDNLVFPGDKYSAGDEARPHFHLES